MPSRLSWSPEETSPDDRARNCSTSHLALDSQHLHRCQPVAERLEVLERPDDLLVSANLEQLGVGGPGVAVADDQIAVGQDVQSSHPGKADSGQFVVADAPDDLALGGHFKDAVVVSSGDHGVTVRQAYGPVD